ncbi:PA2817 family protein [Marinobacterium sp. LSUCC0821]|uniref:PA2817 family protein n=1 Tax=Marinobacterium sp. LSUCC0821 TaxID=2668067 RepID=UPI0014515F52|nr:PA2817 family protein [Marinobacterium sp. LSUCC0821]QJD71321.1 dehydrogenase [Marinobacterium sp. LSUCC0821]
MREIIQPRTTPLTDFHQFHLNLLKIGYNNLIKQPMFHDDEEYSDTAEELLSLYRDTVEAYESHTDEAYELGQRLMTRIVGTFPQFLPLISRDLLWLFGGDCIAYLSDEEIDQYTALDEARYEQEQQDASLDYLQLRNMMLTAGDETQH